MLLALVVLVQWIRTDHDWGTHTWALANGVRWEAGFGFGCFTIIRHDSDAENQSLREDHRQWCIGGFSGNFMIARWGVPSPGSATEPKRWKWQVEMPCWLLVLLGLGLPTRRWIWPFVRRRYASHLHGIRRWLPVTVVLSMMVLWAMSYLIPLGLPTLPLENQITVANGSVFLIHWRQGAPEERKNWTRKVEWQVLGFRYFSGYPMWGTGGPKSPPCSMFQIPCWLPVGIAFPFGIRRWRKFRHERLQRIRQAQGLCLHCGYDLRASTQRCPECGRFLDQCAADGSMA